MHCSPLTGMVFENWINFMDELKLPMCHLLNASVCEEMPQIAARIRKRNDEVIGHGYTNSERQSDMDEATEAAMIAQANGTDAGDFGAWWSERRALRLFVSGEPGERGAGQLRVACRGHPNQLKEQGQRPRRRFMLQCTHMLQCTGLR